MTKLSPATQAIHEAFWRHPNGEPLVQDCPDTDQLIAALRAAAIYSYCPVDRKRLAAIADELETWLTL